MELAPFIFICMFALIFCLTIQKKTLWLNGEQQQRTGQIGWVEGAMDTPTAMGKKKGMPAASFHSHSRPNRTMVNHLRFV